MVSSKIEDPTGYGRIMRDDHGGFERIVEHKDATDTQRMINEINTGIYIFNGRELKESLGKLNNNNAQGEYYLTDCLELILKAGGKVEAVVAKDADEFFGVNSRVQLAEAAKS